MHVRIPTPRHIASLSAVGIGVAVALGQSALGQGEIRRLTVTGTGANSFGSQVSGAGDVNQDGFADVAIANSTLTRIYSGLDGSILRQLPRGGLLELGDIDGDAISDLLIAVASPASLTLYSGATGASIWSVTPGAGALARAGDFNGDGKPDFLAGQSPGIVVRSGLDGSFVKSFAIGFHKLAGGRDLNGDGTPDFITGSSTPNPDLAQVTSGATGALLWSIPSLGNGLAPAVTLLGDVDDDLVPDFAVGEPSWLSLGRVRVFSGATGAQLWQTAGNKSGGTFGHNLIEFPDVNEDGRPDLLVAADYDAATGSAVSSVTALSGRTGAVVFKTFSTDTNDEYGDSLADAGDVNGDGRHDFVVGEPLGSWQAFNTGVSYIYSSHCWAQYADYPGCVGTGGAKPTLAVVGCMSALCTSTIQLTGALGSAPGFLFLRTPGGGLPLGPGCSLILNPILAVSFPFVTTGPSLPAIGTFTLATTMPVGLPSNAQFEMQAVIFDAGVPLGVSASNGVAIFQL